MRGLLFVLMSPLIMIGFGVALEIDFDSKNPTLGSSVVRKVDDGTFNLQIQAIEVTQGVRGDIPSRTAPSDDLTLPMDGAVHIANRRTVVRVYPWVQADTGARVPAVTAQLSAYRDGDLLPGSPIIAQKKLENIPSKWDLDGMRADVEKSWNFVLPSAWTASGTVQESLTLRFVVEINPQGSEHQPECEGCSTDNKVVLDGQKFLNVPPLVIQPYFVEHTVTDRDGSQVTFPSPTIDEFEQVMRNVHRMLPVGDFDRGLNILDPIPVAWQGLLYENERHIFAEAMIDRYLPGGSLRGNQGGTVHLFVFSSDGKYRFLVNYNQNGMRLPLAWTGWPYAQGGARELELVHELTHTLGLSHAGDRNGESTANPDYPDPTGKVEANAYGFDVWGMKAVPPVSDAEETHDFMSYNSLDPAWVSLYTWITIATLLGQPGLDV